MNKIKLFIQKFHIEYLLFASFLMTVIAFSTNYYFVKANQISNGLTIFESYLGANIGWLFFTIILGAYILAIVFCSIDGYYSKRVKQLFFGTLCFQALIYLILVLWVIIDNDYIFNSQRQLGIKGGFGFAFYWFIIHFITSGIVVYLYDEYTGPGEKTIYNILVKNINHPKSQSNRNITKYTELEKAKELLDKGIFTEEEFLQEKHEILEKYKNVI